MTIVLFGNNQLMGRGDKRVTIVLFGNNQLMGGGISL